MIIIKIIVVSWFVCASPAQYTHNSFICKYIHGHVTVLSTFQAIPTALSLRLHKYSITITVLVKTDLGYAAANLAVVTKYLRSPSVFSVFSGCILLRPRGKEHR